MICSMGCERTIEGMKQDLLAGGWTPSFGGTLWTNPWGAMYIGPHLAWHKWAGTPMCSPHDPKPRSLDKSSGELL
jgi:hypothetical protein